MAEHMDWKAFGGRDYGYKAKKTKSVAKKTSWKCKKFASGAFASSRSCRNNKDNAGLSVNLMDTLAGEFPVIDIETDNINLKLVCQDIGPHDKGKSYRCSLKKR